MSTALNSSRRLSLRQVKSYNCVIILLPNESPQATHIKSGLASTSGRLEQLDEFPPPPPPLESQSSVEGKSDSSTSSSSTSEYEALHESKVSMADIARGYKPAGEKIPDLRKPSDYHLKKPSEYHLTDCSSIDTKGRSYSQVVEEHLSRSPSLHTTSAGDTSSEEERRLKAAQGSERLPSKPSQVTAQIESRAAPGDSDSSLSSLPPPPAPYIATGVDKVETIAKKMKTRVDGALEEKEKSTNAEEYQRMVREKKEYFQSSRNSGQGKTLSILSIPFLLLEIFLYLCPASGFESKDRDGSEKQATHSPIDISSGSESSSHYRCYLTIAKADNDFCPKGGYRKAPGKGSRPRLFAAADISKADIDNQCL